MLNWWQTVLPKPMPFPLVLCWETSLSEDMTEVWLDRSERSFAFLLILSLLVQLLLQTICRILVVSYLVFFWKKKMALVLLKFVVSVPIWLLIGSAESRTKCQNAAWGDGSSAPTWRRKIRLVFLPIFSDKKELQTAYSQTNLPIPRPGMTCLDSELAHLA